MNHIVFLVEDLSTERFLEQFLRHFADEFTYEVISFQGKDDFKNNLIGYLRGYASWMPDNYRIISVCDRDLEDCIVLKNEIENRMRIAGLRVKSDFKTTCNSSAWIAIEEIEAWMLGDSAAILQSFPRMEDISRRAKFRDPDNIVGGTWESFERELQKAGYYPSGLLKLELAAIMGSRMSLKNNRSRSFSGFVNRIMEFSG